MRSARALPTSDRPRKAHDILGFMRQELVRGVVVDQEVAFGKPVIAGTRIPVALVLGQLAAGVPEADLCAEYDLEPEQIRAALRYAAWLAQQETYHAGSRDP